MGGPIRSSISGSVVDLELAREAVFVFFFFSSFYTKIAWPKKKKKTNLQEENKDYFRLQFKRTTFKIVRKMWQQPCISVSAGNRAFILHPYPGSRGRGGRQAQKWSLKAHPNYSFLPVRLHLLKIPESSKTVPPCRCQGFRHVSLWGQFTVKPFMAFPPVAQGQLAELGGWQG